MVGDSIKAGRGCGMSSRGYVCGYVCGIMCGFVWGYIRQF